MIAKLQNFEMIKKDGAVLRYAIVSILGYGFALASLFALNFYQIVDDRIAYAVVYSIIYIVQYPITIVYIYKLNHKTSNLWKYGAYLLLNWMLASIIYFALSHLGFNILLSFIMVALIMFPFRFFYGKKVYN